MSISAVAVASKITVAFSFRLAFCRARSLDRVLIPRGSKNEIAEDEDEEKRVGDDDELVAVELRYEMTVLLFNDCSILITSKLNKTGTKNKSAPQTFMMMLLVFDDGETIRTTGCRFPEE